jgi:anti-sigma factor RsiW
MAESVMSHARFEAILDAYGADPRRWPDAERAAARDFSQADARAAALLASAARLDGLIELPAHAPASDALREAIVASAKTRRSRAPLWWAGAGLGAALAGAAAGALTVGVLAPGAAAEFSADQALAAATAFDTFQEAASR